MSELEDLRKENAILRARLAQCMQAARDLVALFTDSDRKEKIHLLQVKYSIGWRRAARLMDALDEMEAK